MSNAVCTKCGKIYGWHAMRGYRLKDFPSPCCKSPGRAVTEADWQKRIAEQALSGEWAKEGVFNSQHVEEARR